jgi:MinD-like ATPase involved in chromosome partitioning or flagellar assembly
VDGNNLTKKIRQMSEYLSEEAIAAAFKMPLATVHDIVLGHLNISETVTEKETVLQVVTQPVYRQRIIAVWRGRGGAGCTSVALHLAYLLEQIMAVLLVDLQTTAVGSDLAHYLHLPEYPNLDTLSRDGCLSSAVIQVESGLWALLPGATAAGGNVVARLITEARREFDAVIFDLPNTDDEGVLEAAACSNALVMVAGGTPQEMNRLLARKNRAQKEAVLVTNGYACGKKYGGSYATVVEIPEDNALQVRMAKGVFYKKGSPFTVGTEKIRDALFGSQPEAKNFGKMMRHLLAGVAGH